MSERLSIDDQEMLESNRAAFLGSDNILAGRFVAGSSIQIGIDEFDVRLSGSRWGICVGTEGEFVAPDDFGGLSIVPVSPVLCLILEQEDSLISRSQVSAVNRLAVEAAKDYYMARDRSQCPL